MKKEKVLKVFGGRYMGRRFNEVPGSKRMVIGAYTKKQAMELGNVTQSEFKNFFCETGNAGELETCTEVGVWIKRSFDDKFLARII